MATKASLRRAAEQSAAACIDAKAAFIAARDLLRQRSDEYNAALLAHTQACEALVAAHPDVEPPAGPSAEKPTPPASKAPDERRGFFARLFR